MEVTLNKTLSHVPKAPCAVDSLKDLPFIPAAPLPPKNFAMYIVGSPGSGKSNLLLSLFMSKKPLFYRGLFDKIHLISASMATLPKSFLKQLPESQKHMEFDDELLFSILQTAQQGENVNTVILLDDVIKDLRRSKILAKTFLNRRHVCHCPQKEGQASLSIITTSQKYTLLPLEFRNACSHFVIFKTSNRVEKDRIRDELMHDLSPEQQDLLLDTAWAEPYSFLFIDLNAPLSKKYHIKFNSVKFN